MKKFLLMLLAVMTVAPSFAKFIVCEHPLNQYNPTLYEDKVYWTDSRLMDRIGNGNIYLYEMFFRQLPFGKETWVNDQHGSNGYSHLDIDAWGDYIVYKRAPSGGRYTGGKLG